MERGAEKVQVRVWVGKECEEERGLAEGVGLGPPPGFCTDRMRSGEVSRA